MFPFLVKFLRINTVMDHSKAYFFDAQTRFLQNFTFECLIHRLTLFDFSSGNSKGVRPFVCLNQQNIFLIENKGTHGGDGEDWLASTPLSHRKSLWSLSGVEGPIHQRTNKFHQPLEIIPDKIRSQ